MEQFRILVLDIFRGPCLNHQAEAVIEQFVPLVTIANGQSGFRWMMEEIAHQLAPLAVDALGDIIARTQLDWRLYTSAAIGKRWGVTLDQYERLGFTHITPAGWGKRRMKAYRAKRRAGKVKAQRHAKKASKTPRELSIAQLRPWTLAGAPCSSRAEFYREPKDVRDALVARARAEAA
jgi:hypothetical protein